MCLRHLTPAVGWVLTGLGLFCVSSSSATVPAPAAGARRADDILGTYARLPLAFEMAQDAGFVARGKGYTLSLERRGARIELGRGRAARSTFRMEMEGSGDRGAGEALDPLPGRVNYLIGGDPKRWKRGLRTFGRVRYPDVYPGIDLLYYGNQSRLEFDFVAAPGSNPGGIVLRFSGQDELKLDSAGDLVISAGGESLRFRRPVAYQRAGGANENRPASYRLLSNGRVGFEVTGYDRTQPLVIDPVLDYSAAVGGSWWESSSWYGHGLASGPDGSIYVAGYTYSTDFPLADPYQTRPANSSGGWAFVARLSPDGKQLLSSTLLGAPEGYASAYGIAVDRSGQVLVVGTTDRSNFPLLNPLQSQIAGSQDGFITKLNPACNGLVYSTLIGGSGSDAAFAAALDSGGNAYVVGGIPWAGFADATVDPFQAASDDNARGFLVKLDPEGARTYAMKVPGEAYDVAVDPSGAAYIVGYAWGQFPVTSGAYQTPAGTAYAAKVSADGTGLVYASRFGGGCGDRANAVALDPAGNAYIAGSTCSPDFPVGPGAVLQNSPGGDTDGFVLKLDAAGAARLFSTFLGGQGNDEAKAIAVDSAGNVLAAGNTRSANFPVLHPLQNAKIGATKALFTSSDGGTTWTPTPYPDWYAARLAAQGSVIYASPGYALFRSADGGQSWTRSAETGSSISAIAVDPSNAAIVYAATGRGLSRSADGGGTWVDVKSDGQMNGVRVSQEQPAVVYGWSDSGIFKSVDSGGHWAALSAGRTWALVPDPNDANTLYAGGYGITGPGTGLAKSTDAGATWRALPAAPCCELDKLAVAGGKLYVAVLGKLYRSSDGGITWTSSPIPAGESPTTFAIDPGNPDVMYLGFASSGIYGSTDGGLSWSSLSANTPFRSNRVSALAILPGSPGRVLAGVDTYYDVFVTKLKPDGTGLYSTYLGGRGESTIGGLSADPAGAAVVAVSASDPAFPVAAGAYRSPTRGSGDTYVARIADGDGGCPAALTPASIEADYRGGSAAARVVTGSDCPWTATVPSWMDLYSSASGTGIGLLELSYGPNETGAERTGEIAVAGQKTSVVQAAGPACTLTLGQPLAFTSGESSMWFWVNAWAQGADCAWTASTTDSWITITSEASGTNWGSVRITVAANTAGTARHGEVKITAANGATATQAILQSGANCNATLSATGASIGASGGTTTVQIVDANGCLAWSANGPVWAGAGGTTAGTGPGTVTLNVDANPWTTPRVQTVWIGGLRYEISQAAGNQCSAVPIPFLSPVATALSTSDCASQWNGSGFYARHYSFEGTAGQRIDIEMAALDGALQPLVYLTGPDGRMVTSGYTPAGSRASRIGGVQLPAAGNYIVEASANSQNATGAFRLQVSPSCNGQLERVAGGYQASGGSATLAVTEMTGCTWTASSLTPEWLTVTSAGTGTGNSVVAFQIAANTWPTPRLGALSIAGQIYYVSQAGTTDVFRFDPASADAGPAYSSGTVAVAAGASGSQWTAVSSQPWLSAGGGYYTGDATLSYQVQPNTSPSPRTAEILIGNNSFAVTQAPMSCQIVAPRPVAFSSGSFGYWGVWVSVPSGCEWTATTSDPWITLNAASGTGGAILQFSVPGNAAHAGRAGTITLRSGTETASLRVYQSGVACTPSIVPGEMSFPASGGPATAQVVDPDGCFAWVAPTGYPWLTGTGGGIGSGTMTLDAVANMWTSPRQQQISLRPAGAGTGPSVTISQSAGTQCTASPIAPLSPVAAVLNGTGCTSQWEYTFTSSGTPIPYPDARQYSFPAAAGDRIAVELTGIGHQDIPINLLSPSGTLLDRANPQYAYSNPRIPQSGFLSLPEAGTYTIEVAANTAAAPTLQLIPACDVQLNQTAGAFPSGGGTGSVAFTSTGACTWTATDMAPDWITLTSAASGSGDGTLTFTVGANATGYSRTGTISIGGQIYYVSQAGASVSYYFMPASANAGASGGSGTVAVNPTSPVGWFPVSTQPWLTLSTGFSSWGFYGGATLTYQVAANPDTASRTAQILVGDAAFTVTQAGTGAAMPSVSGTVRDANGVPLAGVDVTLALRVAPGTMQTGADGAYAFRELPDGRYSVRATKAGLDCSPALLTVSVAGTDITSADFECKQAAGILTGYIQGWPESAADLILGAGVSPVRASWSINTAGKGWFYGNPPAEVAYAGGITDISQLRDAASLSFTTSSVGPVCDSSCGTGSFVVWRSNGYYAVLRVNSVTWTGGLSGQWWYQTNGTGNFSEGGVAGTRFVPVTPCRVADTRMSGGALPAQGSRDFAVAGTCGIPAGAKAYALNVTVVPHGPLGYLTVWPAGQPMQETSLLNSFDGRIKANAAIVPAGEGGAISVYAKDESDVVVDINGYFADPESSPASSVFYPVAPCRIGDTREAEGALHAPALGTGETRTVPVGGACGIPAYATAYSLNFTVVPKKPLGFLSAWPAGQPQPPVSTLNAIEGKVTANAAIVPAGADGAINVFATDDTELILDVNGYFAPPGTAGGLRFYTLNPCRPVDTRDMAKGGPALSGSRDFQISGTCGAPASAQAYVLNATVVPGPMLGYLTLWPTGGEQPLVSTLNSFDGTVTSNMAIVPAGAGGKAAAYATDLTELILDISGYFAP